MRGALAAMEDLLLPSSLLPVPTEKPRPGPGLGGSGTMRDSTGAVEVSASVMADASCFPLGVSALVELRSFGKEGAGKLWCWRPP